MVEGAISAPALEQVVGPPAALDRPDFEIVPRRRLIVVEAGSELG